MEKEIKTKKCKKCGQVNLLRARYCYNPNCDYIFPEDEPQDTPLMEPEPKKQTTTPPQSASQNSGDSFAPIMDFEKLSDDIVSKINEEIKKGIQRLKSINPLKDSLDETVKKTYAIYLDNFEIVESSMKTVEKLSKELESGYITSKTRLKQSDPLLQRSLNRAYTEKKDAILLRIGQMINDFKKQKPFDLCRDYQLTPFSDWDDVSHHNPLPGRYLYLGEVGHKFHILGQTFEISRREYLELLNCQNLILHYDKRSKDKGLNLVTTLISRMLKAVEEPFLQICVVDPKLGLGLGRDFKGLPQNFYEVTKEIDTEKLLNQEIQILQLTEGRSVEAYNHQAIHEGGNGLGYQIVVFKDWHATVEGRIDEDEIRDMVNNSPKAGFCFIFMVDNDKSPDGANHSGRMDDELLTSLANCKVIDLRKQWSGEDQQLELMNENQIFEVVKEVRHRSMPQSRDIDTGALLEDKKRWGTSSCQDSFSLFIGKDSNLQDQELRFEDDIIHQSLLVNYRSTKSSVFPWINAMIAQAFSLYDPSELNVLVADFTGSEELAFLNDNRNLTEPPFYYLGAGLTSSKEKVGNQFPKIFTSYFNNADRRLLAFIIGKYEDIKKYVVDKFYLTKDRIHLVLVVTDFVGDDTRKQSRFEGYQLSFGPMRVESRGHYREEGKSQSISGDEFIFEGNTCQAYTYSMEKTKQIVQKFAKKAAIAPTPAIVPTPVQTEPKNLEQVIEVVAAPEEANPVKATSAEQNENPIAIVNDTDEVATIGVEQEKEEEKYDYQRVFKFSDYMLPESEWWKESCANVLEVPFGIHINRETDKDDIWSFWFEKTETMSNAALVLGGSGSGKTTFLQTLIMSAAQRYSPKELELYLIDFKNIGFLPFEKYRLPHARVVASGADREFGLSILRRLEAELAERMQNLEKRYPRTVLIIDECQDFFLGDSIADDAASILERLTKKGRDFGINIIIATQELASNTTAIPSSLYKNIAIRVVAKPTDTDYLELFDRMSSEEWTTLNTSYKKGELLFVRNTTMGKGTSIEDYHAKSFYIQYDKEKIDHSELKELIERLTMFASTHKEDCPENKDMFVFHNDAPLVNFSNRRMKEAHRHPIKELPKEIPLYLGQPIAIDDDVYIALKQDRYQNVLVIGASDEILGQGIVFNALLSSLDVYPKGKRIDYVFDFTQSDEPLYGQLAKVIKKPPFNPKSEVIQNCEDDVTQKLSEIKALLEERMGHQHDKVNSHVFVTFFGLDRGGMFGVDFANTEGYFENFLEATNLLNFIIKNGPRYGVFTLIQFTGRLNLLSQMLNIGSSFDLFTHIVALQMEEIESLNLMNHARFLYDQRSAQVTPGLYRALYYNRSNSYNIQKIKPYNF